MAHNLATQPVYSEIASLVSDGLDVLKAHVEGMVLIDDVTSKDKVASVLSGLVVLWSDLIASNGYNNFEWTWISVPNYTWYTIALSWDLSVVSLYPLVLTDVEYNATRLSLLVRQLDSNLSFCLSVLPDEFEEEKDAERAKKMIKKLAKSELQRMKEIMLISNFDEVTSSSTHSLSIVNSSTQMSIALSHYIAPSLNRLIKLTGGEVLEPAALTLETARVRRSSGQKSARNLTYE